MIVATTTEVPITEDRDGVLRVGQTRITLDAVVAAFLEGASAEEIVEDFPGLELADVYATIAYYLRHRDETDAYLKQRQTDAEILQKKIQTRCPVNGLRERLLARRMANG